MTSLNESHVEVTALAWLCRVARPPESSGKDRGFHSVCPLTCGYLSGLTAKHDSSLGNNVR